MDSINISSCVTSKKGLLADCNIVGVVKAMDLLFAFKSNSSPAPPPQGICSRMEEREGEREACWSGAGKWWIREPLCEH